ncbi:MAG: hypothetical protein R3E88_19475 [Myxococcota bacterium]
MSRSPCSPHSAPARPRARRALVCGVAALALAATACGGPDPIVACEPANGITPVCGFHNPEDLVVDASGSWLIVSQAPLGEHRGELVAYEPATGERRTLHPSTVAPVGAPSATAGDASCDGPPDPAQFAPHGIDLAPDGATLYVVGHGAREAVEIFRASATPRGPRLEWIGCVAMPEGAMMNDVAAMPDGDGFVVSRMTTLGLGGMVAIARGGTTGEVLRYSRASGLRPVPGTTGAAPNGVAVARDGSAVYFAEWSAGSVTRVALDGSGRRSASVGFSPDNLSWRADGGLLVAGQRATPLQATACFDVEEGSCGLASAVAVLDPETLAVRRILTNDPAVAIGGVSAAVAHAGRIWLGSFGGDRIAWIDAARADAP